MNRYLGFTPGRYGDIFMGTVAARCLKASDPTCHLTFVIGSDYHEAAPLFINHPHIDRIHVLHGKDDFDEVDHAWIATQGFTHIFNPKQDHDHSRPWWRERHQTLETAHMYGIPIPAGESGKITMERWFEIRTQWPNTIALAPFPAWYAGPNNLKALSPTRAQEIVDYIKGKGLNVLQVGAPGEPSLRDTIHQSTPYLHSVMNVLRCRAFICGDSGLNWLMSGYNHPVLGLYGDSYYGGQCVNIQPINPNAIYLSAPTVAEIPMDRIKVSIDTLLA